MPTPLSSSPLFVPYRRVRPTEQGDAEDDEQRRGELLHHPDALDALTHDVHLGRPEDAVARQLGPRDAQKGNGSDGAGEGGRGGSGGGGGGC